ncbi:MAG TPA: NUDIX domain-containing protein, partial [Rhizobiales bacterium]|nr:NUDIX domain-containing protein [Hyphomicrobiales bacterium]
MDSQKLAELKKLPLRENVGIMLLNKEGRIWVGRRLQQWMPEASEFVWQMPQGGIDKGESPKQAAFR